MRDFGMAHAPIGECRENPAGWDFHQKVVPPVKRKN
jgi:hypothetical protein